MLRFKALDHVGILVTDMDRSLHFYTEGLGLELLRRRGAGRDGFAALQAGQTEFNVFCNPGLVSDGAPQLVDHLCLVMDYRTIDDLIAALREAAIDIASGPVKRSDGAALFVRDPDGLRIELLVKDRISAAERRVLLEEIQAAAARKATPGASAARSQDFLYDPKADP